MAISRDLAKKLYQNTLNYPDGMRQITNKFLWNRVLNKFPRLAEFFLTGLNKRELTTLERSLAEYIRQSELVKPYRPVPYHESEYAWPPPNGGSNPPGPGPGGEENPGEEDEPPWEPGNYICHATLETGCWCRNDDNGQRFIIHGTYPIDSISVMFHTDAKIEITAGLGTLRVEGNVHAGEHVVAVVPIRVHMRHPLGSECSMVLYIHRCSEATCCDRMPMECHEDNQTTIGINSDTEIVFTGGRPRFKYTISGDGFWFDQGFTKTETKSSSRFITIYTDGSSCGTGIITVTDDCKSTAACSIRNTAGQWAFKGEGSVCCGEKDGGGGCGSGIVCTHTEGECKQQTRFGQCQGCAGSCNCWERDCSHCDGIPACSNGFDNCIPYGDCGVGLQTCGAQAQVLLCYEPCQSPPGAGGFTRGLCYANTEGYPRYFLWECIP